MGRRLLRVHGRSMWPFLKDGEQIEICPDRTRFQLGEIIVFHGAPTLKGAAAHRLIRLLDGSGTPLLVTKGDGQIIYDEPVRPSDVFGVVVGVINRSGAYVSLNSSSFRFFAWLIAKHARFVGSSRDRIHALAKTSFGTSRTGMRMALKIRMTSLPYAVLHAYNFVFNGIIWTGMSILRKIDPWSR